jgi:hypothetical protein
MSYPLLPSSMSLPLELLYLLSYTILGHDTVVTRLVFPVGLEDLPVSRLLDELHEAGRGGILYSKNSKVLSGQIVSA